MSHPSCLRPDDHNAGREHGQNSCDCRFIYGHRHPADLPKAKPDGFTYSEWDNVQKAARKRHGLPPGATDAPSGEDQPTTELPMDPDVDLQHRFGYHPPSSPVVVKAHEDARDELRVAAEFVVESLPPCRERATALTKLEEAMFWANAAIARNMNGSR